MQWVTAGSSLNGVVFTNNALPRAEIPRGEKATDISG
jgi:hypothetical protein